MEQDEFSILRHLLGTDSVNRFVLSKSYITTRALADNEVSTFRAVSFTQFSVKKLTDLFEQQNCNEIYLYSIHQVALFLSDSILEALQVYSGLKEPGTFFIFLWIIHY